MNAELVLPRKLVNQILTHAQQHEHTESCGLISTSDGNPAHYYAVKNIATDPSTRFEMEPKQQIAAMKHMREHSEDAGGGLSRSLLHHRIAEYQGCAGNAWIQNWPCRNAACRAAL